MPMTVTVRLCVICSDEVHAERLAMHSGVLTCSKACAKRHKLNILKRAARRYRERQKAKRAAEAAR